MATSAPRTFKLLQRDFTLLFWGGRFQEHSIGYQGSSGLTLFHARFIPTGMSRAWREAHVQERYITPDLLDYRDNSSPVLARSVLFVPERARPGDLRCRTPVPFSSLSPRPARWRKCFDRPRRVRGCWAHGASRHPVIRFTDIDDAVRCVNDTRYGLGGSVWTNDLKMVAEIDDSRDKRSLPKGKRRRFRNPGLRKPISCFLACGTSPRPLCGAIRFRIKRPLDSLKEAE